jgi:hypothetical protein
VITGLLADADVQGHVRIIVAACESPDWREFWAEVRVPVLFFPDVGLPPDAPDAEVWGLCQDRRLVLITGNRNLEGPDALEAVLRSLGTAESLPVFTLADRERIAADRVYAERVVARLIELFAGHRRSPGRGPALPAVSRLVYTGGTGL